MKQIPAGQRRTILDGVAMTRKIVESSIGNELASRDCVWMSSKEAASYLRIPVGSLRNQVSRGTLPYYKFRRSLRFKRTELDRFIEGTRRGGWR